MDNPDHTKLVGDGRTDHHPPLSAALSREVEPVEGTVYCSPEPGFSIVSFNRQALELRMIDRRGNVLHTVARSK